MTYPIALLQVLVHLVEEAFGGEPRLLGTDQERQIRGHEAGLEVSTHTFFCVPAKRDCPPGQTQIADRDPSGYAGCDQADTRACREAGSEAHLLAELRAAYPGRSVMGRDLQVY